MTICIKCKQEKEKNSFISNRGNVREKCDSCCREEFNRYGSKRSKDDKSKHMKSWIKNNPDYMREYRKVNSQKRSEYNKKWKVENREKYLARRREYKKKVKIDHPEIYFLNRIQNMLCCAKHRAKSQKALNAFGVSSTEEFISLMSNKTENKNWIKDFYQLDHIWQLNWFREKIRENEFNFDLYSGFINHHSNLRPLSADENTSRSLLDFSCLNREDFEKFRPLLNDFVIDGIEFYFNGHFSGKRILKRSDEEDLIIKYLISIGWGNRCKHITQFIKRGDKTKNGEAENPP